MSLKATGEQTCFTIRLLREAIDRKTTYGNVRGNPETPKNWGKYTLKHRPFSPTSSKAIKFQHPPNSLVTVNRCVKKYRTYVIC